MYTHRAWGKRLNHALNYGMGADKFSLMTELPLSEARTLVERYHEVYPGIRRNFHEGIQRQLLRDRTLVNCFGRRRTFLDRKSSSLLKEAYSFIPQSNTADIINRWGVLPFYYEERFADVWILRQVHDSVDFQIPLRLGSHRIAEIIADMNTSLTQTLTWKHREFVIPAEFKVGFNLGQLTKLTINETLQGQLQTIVEDGNAKGN